MILSTEDLIRASVERFAVPRGYRFIHAGGRGMQTRTPAERVLVLPNGTRARPGNKVKIYVDDSGVATQIEEDEHLHAVVRPHPIKQGRRRQ